MRMLCRTYFSRLDLLSRIPDDLEKLFEFSESENMLNEDNAGMLWTGEEEEDEGGVNYGGQA